MVMEPITAVREPSAWDEAELAGAASVSANTLHRIENGSQASRPATSGRIAAALVVE